MQNVAEINEDEMNVQENKNLSTDLNYEKMANAIRVLSMDAVEKAASGHPGMPMGMADVATILFSEFLKYDPANPQWVDRDRFILSAGHGSMLLYSLLYLTGYEDMTIDEIKNFRQLGSKTTGHPEYGLAGGIETTTGPLGQGMGNAAGMALAERLLAAKFGDDVVDHYTYALAGDGCLMEGICQETISLAGHLKLSKLIVLFDDNNTTIDGNTDLTTSEDHKKRFEACGWDVQKVDGHDFDAIREAIANAKETDTPSMIAFKTEIAKGAPTKAGTSAAHGAPLGEEEIKGARKALGWEEDEPFVIPEDILEDWRGVGERGAAAYTQYMDNLSSKDAEFRLEFERTQKGVLPEGVHQAILGLKKRFANSEKVATRKSSENVLEELTKTIPEMIGGSADLTGSNLTKTSSLDPVSADSFLGRYIYYGIREHAMCAMMNGMALHNGLIVYGGTFFIFTDYCRPSIRLAALMNQPVIYVMTHDSIGLGEDGPTHQPVEHLASLRAMPNLHIYRPADATETAECWEMALNRHDGPSMLVLSRQGLPSLRNEFVEENYCEKGGYVISPAKGETKVTLIATGSEVSLAMEVQKTLREEDGIESAVVSMPCTELFDEQPEAYQNEVLPEDSLIVGIEAGSSYGWIRYVGRKGIFIGMDSFGGSAPANDLYTHFGITAENTLKQIRQKLKD